MSSWDDVTAFIDAVDWTEPWIGLALAFQFSVLIFAILTRKNWNMQCFNFFVIIFFLFLIESVNDWANENYASFSKQNYFTNDGVFILVLVSPLILTCFFLLFSMLYEVGETLVVVKSAQIKNKIQKEERAKKKVD